MAPEQLLKKPFDHRADIFAFGVMAYELVTEQKPFQGESPEQTLLAQITGKHSERQLIEIQRCLRR